MSMWRWSQKFDALPESAQITLGEGNTPLVRSRKIGPEAGLKNLFFKLECCNPSGSYKDRFASSAISHMVANGQTRCIATSSGNTGASLAAYCAAAGIDCRIAIVEGAPLGKLKQMMAYGAKIARIRRFGTDPTISEHVLSRLLAIGQRPGNALQISAFVYSPAGMSGVQSISFELAEQSPSLIDHVFCPAGSGGLCIATARGFQQLVVDGVLSKPAAVHCVQPEGNNTVAGPLRQGLLKAQTVMCTTKISGLQVASVIDGDIAVTECRATGGNGHLVADDYVWALQKRLAREEGVFSEPAGVAALAGALQAAAAGEIDPEATVVCLVTGSGFKDDAAIDRMNANDDCPTIDADQLDEW